MKKMREKYEKYLINKAFSVMLAYCILHIAYCILHIAPLYALRARRRADGQASTAASR